MGKKQNIFEFINIVRKKSKHVEALNTGLVGENLIIASYDTRSIEDLEKLRYIINKIITKKKNLRNANKPR